MLIEDEGYNLSQIHKQKTPQVHNDKNNKIEKALNQITS